MQCAKIVLDKTLLKERLYRRGCEVNVAMNLPHITVHTFSAGCLTDWHLATCDACGHN